MVVVVVVEVVEEEVVEEELVEEEVRGGGGGDESPTRWRIVSAVPLGHGRALSPSNQQCWMSGCRNLVT